MEPKRICKTAILVKPSTIFKFHRALVKRKYRLLFSSGATKKPGPKGPSRELINAVLAIKRKNPAFGCPRIADMIKNTFGHAINKDIVRRILAKHYRPDIDSDGTPSWLTFLAQVKDCLWSLDLFCCESIILKTHWVMIVMEQSTRKIIGFSVYCGNPSGSVLCAMFSDILFGKSPPKYLSTDHCPLFKFHRWKANLRIYEIDEIKTVPEAPLSHPFIERLIGTTRREYLDRVMFWDKADLERKLVEFQKYYNEARGHSALNGKSPMQVDKNSQPPKANLSNFKWKSYCRGLFQVPVAV